MRQPPARTLADHADGVADRKILIANRGDVALRVGRSAAALGASAVSVYVPEDSGSLHVLLAQEARVLPGAGSAGYLDIEALVDAATDTGCTHVHPGWGFLSEDPDFARACAREGLVFVGPAPETLALFGDKATARAHASAAAVPVLDATEAGGHDQPGPGVPAPVPRRGDGEGRRRRRRTGNARRHRHDPARRSVRAVPLRGTQGVRARGAVRRAAPHRRQAHRGTGARRRQRQRRLPRRTRVQRPATPPEAARGGAEPLPGRPAAPRARPARRPTRRGGVLRRPRYGRVPRGRGRGRPGPWRAARGVHRGEPAAAGRAHRDRGGHGTGPGAGATAGRGRRDPGRARPHTRTRARPHRLRHPSQGQRRGLDRHRRHLPVHRNADQVPHARPPGRARGHARAGRAAPQRFLRLAARQSRRTCQVRRLRGGGGPCPARPERVRDRRRRHERGGAAGGPRAPNLPRRPYDQTVLAGTQGYFGHKKTDRLIEIAERRDLPVVLFAEGGGGRPGEIDAADIASSYLDTRTFALLARLSGQVPLVGVLTAHSYAGKAGLLGVCDVIIATKDSTLGMAGPAMIQSAGLGTFTPEQVGPMTVHSANGVVDVLVPDDAQAVAVAKRYLSYCQGRRESWTCQDQRVLRQTVPDDRRRVYDVRRVIEVLADTDSVLELRAGFGAGAVTALVRIEGRPVGLIANNPAHLGGAVDTPAADKIARFLQLCDGHGLPVVSLCDTPGFMVGPESEKTATVRHLSRLFVIGANLRVPLVTVVLRKGYGLGGQAMAGGGFRETLATLAWPTGEVGPMGLEGAVQLGYSREQEAIADEGTRQARYQELVAQHYESGKAVNAAMVVELDDVIDPADTRRWVSSAFVGWNPTTEPHRSYIDTW